MVGVDINGQRATYKATAITQKQTGQPMIMNNNDKLQNYERKQFR